MVDEDRSAYTGANDTAADSESLILVDEADREVGHMSKAQCHQGRGVLHRAFSLLIFNAGGELLLQQRAASKRLWPLYWSNSCCSHPRRAETMETAIHRRLHEELGLRCALHFLYKFHYQAQFDVAGAEKRYPLVLMLEPLFQCNLACAGCGKIDYPKEILQKRVSVEDALRAVDECGAPMVSIPGGEPLIHKEMPQIVAGIVARKKFIYLCTNAILLSKHIDEYQPSPYLTFSIHLDGKRHRHDESVCQEGVYDKAVAAIKLAKSKGFRVTINCTLFVGEIRRKSPSSSMRRWPWGSMASPFRRDSAISTRPIRMSSWAAVPASSCSATFSNSGVGVNRGRGNSISPRCSWISWRAIKPINARRGALLPTTCSAGNDRAICYRIRATHPPSLADG
jgi:isopentenyl-diphosphate delta-isomerase type 1